MSRLLRAERERYAQRCGMSLDLAVNVSVRQLLASRKPPPGPRAVPQFDRPANPASVGVPGGSGASGAYQPARMLAGRSAVPSGTVSGTTPAPSHGEHHASSVPPVPSQATHTPIRTTKSPAR